MNAPLPYQRTPTREYSAASSMVTFRSTRSRIWSNRVTRQPSGSRGRSRVLHARSLRAAPALWPISSAIRASFARMLSTSSAGGRCSSRSGARGFLRSRLKPFPLKTSSRNLPRVIRLAAIAPPFEKWLELLELQRLRLRVVLAPLGQRMLVVPHLRRRTGAVEEQDVRRDRRVRREHPVRQPDHGVEVEVLDKLLLDPRRDAVAEERAVRHDDPGTAAGLRSWPGRRSLRMMSWRNSSAVSDVCLSSGKLRWMPFSSSPPNGGLVTITSTRSRSPISLMRNAERVARVDLRRLEPVQEQVHLAEQVRQRLRLDPVERRPLEALELLDRLRERPDVLVRLDQEAAGPAAGIEHDLAELRVDRLAR